MASQILEQARGTKDWESSIIDKTCMQNCTCYTSIKSSLNLVCCILPTLYKRKLCGGVILNQIAQQFDAMDKLNSMPWLGAISAQMQLLRCESFELF